MITIKFNGYSPRELVTLNNLFNTMKIALITNYCYDGHCGYCQNRRICEDIHETSAYLNKRVGEMNNQ